MGPTCPIPDKSKYKNIYERDAPPPQHRDEDWVSCIFIAGTRDQAYGPPHQILPLAPSVSQKLTRGFSYILPRIPSFETVSSDPKRCRRGGARSLTNSQSQAAPYHRTVGASPRRHQVASLIFYEHKPGIRFPHRFDRFPPLCLGLLRPALFDAGVAFSINYTLRLSLP